MFSDKTTQKYASGSDTEDDDEDDYEDKNIGYKTNTLDVVMDSDRVSKGGEENKIHTQLIYNMI